MRNRLITSSGFTLIETIIGVGLFVIIGTAVYFSYSNIFDISIASQVNSITAALAEREVEVVRNMAYEDVGTVGGVPAGVLPASKSINFDGIPFVINTSVRNVDDPFDGTLGGTPNDTAPGDYKLIEFDIECPDCTRFFPFKAVTFVGPKVIESSSGNGILSVQVFNAFGQPISGANVLVVNSAVSPAVNVADTTDTNGIFRLVDIIPVSGYRITVSKSGFSSERTYSPGDVQNPNPIKPDATVAQDQVTETSFAIDRLSTLNLKTQDKFCKDVPNINFNNVSSKLIGTNPDIFKYSVSATTNGTGNYSNPALEWDGYVMTETDPSYDIAGMSVLNPVIVNPNSTVNLTWIMEPQIPMAMTVRIKDEDDQPVNDAVIQLSKPGYSGTKMSGQNYFEQADWSLGKYSDKSVNIDADSLAGQVSLLAVAGVYASNSDEWLESKVIDMGTNSVQYLTFSWQGSQPGQTSVKFQLASNNDNSSWNFIGPDGSAGSYYETTGMGINPAHNNNRYLKYKIYLRTENENQTPSVNDVSFTFKSSCLADGQAFFSGLEAGDYTLDISKPGYINLQMPITVNSNWQMQDLILYQP